MEPQYYLIVDFEATCCDRGTVSRDHMEIIEIGAVMADAATLAAVSEYQGFIRPVRHPRLTAFCTQLTSINQADVDVAPHFADAVKSFKQWLYQFSGFVFCSWGDYDLKQLRQDCDYHKVPYPINAPHLNLKSLIVEKQGLSKKPGLGDAVAMAGLTFSGTHHRGIDDARNITQLLPYIFGDARIVAPARPKGR